MQNALQPLPGVAEVQVDVSSGKATLRVNAGEFDAKRAIAALAEAGYDGASVED